MAAGEAPISSGASRRGIALGLTVSAVAVAAVVVWAVDQPAPRLPDSAADVGWVGIALALYAVATCLRAERWRVLVADQGGRPRRGDTYALTLVGFAANNVLPARAGDAFRVLLGAPRMAVSRRALIGTLLAERVLDVAVLVTLFVVLALTIAGGEGLPEGRTLELAVSGAVAIALVASVVLAIARRHSAWRRVHGAIAPMLASTASLRGRHGIAMLAASVAIWTLEGLVWTATGAAVDVGFGVLDGFYVLALASMFALVPSGPGYAGTVDAATILGVKAVGGSSRAAVSYLVLVRFVVFVPITVAGLIVGALRYGTALRRPAA